MPDREGVINHLRILRTWCKINLDYGVGLSIEDCRSAVKWLDAALELLKEREPVEPLRINHDTKWQRDTECICGECGGSFYRLKVNFCPWCGKAVKWND